MRIIDFITSYGYATVFVGSIFEGETILVLGGLAAYEGYLRLYIIIPVAFLGALAGDWSFFFLGRRYGRNLVEKWPWLCANYDKYRCAIDNNTKKISFSLRFMYGFRHIVPFSLGMSKVKTRQFLIFHCLGAAAWALTIGAAGYLAGEALNAILGSLKKYEFKIIVITVLAAAAAGALYRGFRFLVRRHAEKKTSRP